MTIELSTIIPSVTISAANVTVFSSMPKAKKSPKEMKMEIGMVLAATNATRMGSSNITTPTTAMMAMSSS